MSDVVIKGNASGTGSVTIESPNTNSNFTLTLPTETGTVLTNNGNQAGTFSSLTVNSNNISADNSMGFRNRIINGDMRIDQRNAGASVTPTDGQYTLDRWRCLQAVSSKYSAQQSSVAPSGFSNSFLATSLSAYSVGSSEYFVVEQIIEGFNTADLNWGTANAKTVTLSFWVYSSLTGTFGGAFRNSAANRSYPFTYTISSASTWEQKTITVAGDTTGTWVGATNGKGIEIKFGLGVGSTLSGTAGAWAGANYVSATGATSVVGTNGATWYITGVQLEVGSVATPFERRPYGTELALCQRYYYKEPASQYHTAILDGAADFPSAFVYHPVEMRATPTTVFEALLRFDYNSGSAGANFTPSGGTTAYVGNTRLGVSRKNSISNAPASSNSQRNGQWDVQLSFSAEL
jgi:hypothetical protein